MDPTRDNPMLRFATFWWGLGAFLVFVFLFGVIWVFSRREAVDPEESVAQTRYETRARIDAEQSAALPEETILAAMEKVAGEIVGAKAAAVERPDQVVPGSAAAEALAAEPAVDTTAIDDAAAELDPEAPIDSAVMELGQKTFVTCSACHGPNGEGGPIGPPLAESEWVNGPISNLIRIQLRGLTGPITIKGEVREYPAPMAPLAHQSDEEIAAVITYVRNSFGNKASAVTPDQVKALRGEVGRPMLTEQDLVKP